MTITFGDHRFPHARLRHIVGGKKGSLTRKKRGETHVDKRSEQSRLTRTEYSTSTLSQAWQINGRWIKKSTGGQRKPPILKKTSGNEIPTTRMVSDKRQALSTGIALETVV